MDTEPWAAPGAVVGSCLGAWLVGLGSGAGPIDVAWFGGALAPAAVRAGQIWRLAAAPWLHVDPGHLALNALVLLAAGRALVALRGGRAVWVVFCMGGVGGCLASLASGGGHWSLGASGGGTALVLATATLALRRRRLLDATQARWAWFGSVPWILGLAWLTASGAPADHAAHLGGALVGLLWGLWPADGPLALTAAIGLIALGLGGALAHGLSAPPTLEAARGAWPTVPPPAPCLAPAQTNGLVLICRHAASRLPVALGPEDSTEARRLAEGWGLRFLTGSEM